MSPDFRDVLAMRRLNTMRNRSAEAQRAAAELRREAAAGPDTCTCPFCVSRRAMGGHSVAALIGSLGAALSEATELPEPTVLPPGSAKH